MELYVFVLAGKTDTHWNAQYIKGIREEARRRSIELHIVEYRKHEPLNVTAEMSAAGVAIVIADACQRTVRVCRQLCDAHIRPVLLGYDYAEDIPACGFVLMDYKKAVTDLLRYFNDCRREKVALFAVSLDSPMDQLKTDAFLSFDNGKYSQKDVFYFRGLTKSTCESFISVYRNYDAVIGTNDVSTVILMQMLKSAGIRVPDDLYVASFGDVALSQSTTNEITLALLDCRNAGKRAVELFCMLGETSELSGAILRLDCAIDVRSSTANVPLPAHRVGNDSVAGTEYADFFSDPHISEIVLAEKVLSKCDSIDLEIMRLLLNEEKYIDIADKLHVSENTVKYRIKRLLNLGDIENRARLLEIMKSYLL